MDEVGLGRQLQKARQAAGLTQQELCHQAGLSYSTLAKIERGAIKSPSIFTIQSIANALGTDLNSLLGDLAPKGHAAKGRSKSGVRFVFFDINGCLVRFFHRAFTAIAVETGAPVDLVETTFWHYNDAVCRGEMPLEEFERIFAERLQLDQPVNWSDYYLSAVEPIEEMHELVRWASQHYQVGLLSNIMPGLIDKMLKRGLLPRAPYAAIVDSSKVGAIKPETKVFETAQSMTYCDPKEILLIDDSRANVMAAEKCGWHVIWFDDYRSDESVNRVRTALELA